MRSRGRYAVSKHSEVASVDDIRCDTAFFQNSEEQIRYVQTFFGLFPGESPFINR